MKWSELAKAFILAALLPLSAASASGLGESTQKICPTHRVSSESTPTIGGFEFIPRDGERGWGAKHQAEDGPLVKAMKLMRGEEAHPPTPYADRITFHETENSLPEKGVDVRDRMHSLEDQHFKQFKGTVSYHFVITRDQTGRPVIAEGTPLNAQGNHTKDANPRNIGISMDGYYKGGKAVPKEMQDAAAALVTYLQNRDDTKRATLIAVHGLKSSGCAMNCHQTDCPGQGVVDMVKNRIAGKIGKTELYQNKTGSQWADLHPYDKSARNPDAASKKKK